MRKSLLSFLLIAVATNGPAVAQMRFEAPMLTQFAGAGPTEDYRYRLSIGDVNHDGMLDVVTASWFGALVLLGKGDGSLELPIVAGGYARFSAVADIDDDGHSDIVGCSSLMFGDGSGRQWQLVSLPDPGSGNGGVVAGDFDGDGAMDYATHVFPETVRTFLSRPHRTFQRVLGAAGIPEANETNVMRACDLNRDGRLDIVLQTSAGRFAALVGAGDGTFHRPPSPFAGGWRGGLDVGDIDSDSIPDLAIVQGTSVAWLKGLGDGTFGAPQAAAPDTIYELEVVLGDVDGDGTLDLVTFSTVGMELRVRMGNGDGTFGPIISTPTWAELLGFELADMNSDGHLDVVSLLESAQGVAVALGDGAGRFGLRPTRYAVGGLFRVAVGEVTGDGLPDIVASSGYGASTVLKVFPNLGGRQHGPAIVSAVGHPQLWLPDAIQLVDLDRDGRLDALLNLQWVALGNGDGTFKPLFLLGHPYDQARLAPQFVNGDSIPDLIGTGPNALRVWLGLGGGAFGNPIDSPLPATPGGIATGDLDNDGDLDLGLVLDQPGDAGHVVSHALGAGDGTFIWDAASWTPLPRAVNSIVMADITGDGRDDLVTITALRPADAYGHICAGLQCSQAAARIQTPAGTLTPWSVTAWPEAYDPQVADVDLDGTQDLVMRNQAGFFVALADGGGGFTIDPGYATGEFRIPSQIADLDLDGRPDAVQTGIYDYVIFYGRDPRSPEVDVPQPRPVSSPVRTMILSAFPNPSHAGLRVSFRAPVPGPVTLRLLDVTGRETRTLYRGVVEPGATGADLTASTGNLQVPPGLYFLILSSRAGTDTRRVAVVR